MHYVACAPEVEITPSCLDVFSEKETAVNEKEIVLPAAAVAAIEITLAK